MDKIDLPGDAWAQLRDPDMVTERQRRPVLTALGSAGSTEGVGFEEISNVSDTLILALVESWSFDLPLAADSLLDLPAKVYDALGRECQKRLPLLLAEFGPDAAKDPASPTAPSNA